ncbi:hypothetical protein [Zooshikella ganghwensis]|uniref:J domain-containing protein n=1 Tax=Zooshikella ganghwensis TaxID=202772 RepID=A0A4V1IN13_9GAMM|nr:hypothetical protein [Zooshikella ganghwensis]RDH42131.1 hypothetical protein B9G39_00995 [Zooshikella ganghwensis]
MTTLTITDFATQSNSNNPANKEWRKLQKLWHEIDKKQARNQRYEKKVSDFFEQFKGQVQTHEQSVCIAVEKYIRHLLTFIPRKTIKGSQREALYAWIEDELRALDANPFRQFSIEPLRDDFLQAVLNFSHKPLQKLNLDAEELDYFREDLADMIGEKAFSLSDEELTNLLKEPSDLKKFLEMFIQETFHDSDDETHEDTDGNAFDDDFFHHRGYSHHEHQVSSEKGLAFFKDKEITMLYRQLANRLHPDKEHDPQKKQHKKELMQQLSQAKKDKDTVAMILLAQTHLPDFEFKLDKKTFSGLQAALEDKIRQLNQAYYQQQQGSDIQSQVWKKFGGGSKHSREKTITEYTLHLSSQVKELEREITELKTVKKMQSVLRSRIEQEFIYELLEHEFFE